jgi:hypothetical protein
VLCGVVDSSSRSSGGVDMVGELSCVGLCMCRGMVAGKVGNVDGIMACCGYCGILDMVGVVAGGMVWVVSNVVDVVVGDIWLVGGVCFTFVVGVLVGGVCGCVDVLVQLLQILSEFLVVFVLVLFLAKVYSRS